MHSYSNISSKVFFSQIETSKVSLKDTLKVRTIQNQKDLQLTCNNA